jgi:hypothetical protein
MNARQQKQYKDSPEILKKSILSMRKKIIDSEEQFLAAPLTIEAEMGDGRYVTRANPVVQEYRALIRDFSAALKAYKDITGDQNSAEVNSLDDLRAKFRVAK